MSMVNLVTCVFSLFWTTSWCFRSKIFQGFILDLIKKNDSMQGHVAEIFKVETLLNNAFKKKHFLKEL